MAHRTEDAIVDGNNLARSLIELELWDEAISLSRDQLLPTARRSLGADHDITLDLNKSLANAIQDDPRHARNGQRLNRGVDVTRS